MIKLIKSRSSSKAGLCSTVEYEKCVSDLLRNEAVRSMKNFLQHKNVSCLEHSIFVSYTSYLVCRRLGLDFLSAARGGLLHDFFLYDWHITKTEKGLHGFLHPYTALENAERHFQLNRVEKDIIVKHMWPLTIKLPLCGEALVVSLVDKYCTLVEMFRYKRQALRILGYIPE